MATLINRSTLRNDLLAGVTGAVAGAPQAMGFALIAGVNPIYGLYTAVVSTIVSAFAGSSTYMTVGPTNALSLVVFSIIGSHVGDAQIERLFVLTLLTGVFFFLFGVLRLGMLVRFVSNAVMTGFITGAGLLIIFGQVRHINGYQAAPDATPLSFLPPALLDVMPSATLRFVDWLQHLPQSDPRTLIIGLSAMGIILFVQRTRFKNWAILVAIITATIAVKLLNWESDVALVSTISAVPRGLPAPVIPDFGLISELVGGAFAIAVLGAVQSAALTNSIPEPDGSNSNTSRDFIGMGIGNILGAVFQGIPACGSLSRTAVNIKAGGKTRWANAFAGIIVALFLLALGPLVEQVTLAALAAQLIIAAISLLRPSQIRLVWRVNWAARSAMVATFVSTLLLPLEFSIYVGVIISLLLYVYISSERLQVELLVPLENNRYKVEPMPEKLPDNDIVILTVQGDLYFAAVRRLEAILPNPKQCKRTTMILRLRENDYLGSTGIRFLLRYSDMLREGGGRLMLAGLSPKVRRELDRTGISERFGEENLFDAGEIYFEATALAYQAARRFSAEQESAPQSQ